MMTMNKDFYMKQQKQYKVSELFRSIQGEGQYCGIPTLWVRVFGCNFKCLGFNQSHLPRELWKNPYKTLDLTNIKKIEDLPVLDVGCDSAYSHYKEYTKLCPKYTAEEIANKLTSHLPNGKFTQDNKFDYHLAFTGGEPLMSQNMIVDVMTKLKADNNQPRFVTIETNGTQSLNDNFNQFFTPLACDWADEEYGLIKRRVELFFSISPKLYLSGEKWGDAIKPEVVAGYSKISDAGQLKYVCDNSQKVWDQVEKATELYRAAGGQFPVWIMPVGGRLEDQEKIRREIAEECVKRGYNFAARLHCDIWKNRIGT